MMAWNGQCPVHIPCCASMAPQLPVDGCAEARDRERGGLFRGTAFASTEHFASSRMGECRPSGRWVGGRCGMQMLMPCQIAENPTRRSSAGAPPGGDVRTPCALAPCLGRVSPALQQPPGEVRGLHRSPMRRLYRATCLLLCLHAWVYVRCVPDREGGVGRASSAPAT